MPKAQPIKKTEAEKKKDRPKIYICEGCKYNPNTVAFCGFCLKKILDKESDI